MWFSPLAAGTQQEQNGDQQQDSQGAEHNGQNQLPASRPQRRSGIGRHLRADHVRLRPPPHPTQHGSHDASHRGGHWSYQLGEKENDNQCI